MTEFTQLQRIRQARSLVHCVSNIVSANDCANLALAIGASPMMALAPEEMEEITRISASTVLNTGTPDRERFHTCELCFRHAAALARPVILDPVGVGASRWRLREVKALLEKYRPTILRVNLGEVRALCGELGREQGVDSVGDASQAERLLLAKTAAEAYGTTVLLSGKTDLIHDGSRAVLVRGGSDRIGLVTGTGDMLSVLCGAFAAAEPDPLTAAILASSFWKLCAERAEAAAADKGTGELRSALLREAERITDQDLYKAHKAELL